MNIVKYTYEQPFDLVVSLILFYFIFIFSKYIFFYFNKYKLNFFEIINLLIISICLLFFVLINIEVDYLFLRKYLLIFFISVSILFTIKTSKFSFNYEIDNSTLIFLLILFLLSLSPPTDADSLDYHIGVPLEVIINKRYIYRDDWYHYYLMGYGEMINLFGLAHGSKNFGQLINFLGIVNIFYIFSLLKKKNNLKVIYFIFSIPLIIWFITSSKPQLYQSSLIFYCIYIMFDTIKNKDGQIYKKQIFLLSIFFTYCLYSKISFIYTIVIGNFLFLFFIHKKNIKNFIIINTCIFLFLSIPKGITDITVYGKFLFPYIELFTNSKNEELLLFLKTIKNDNATFYSLSALENFVFPFYITVPLSNVILTGLLGISFIFIYYSIYLLLEDIIKKNNKLSIFLLLFIIFKIFVIIKLPNMQPRYMLEIYWLNSIILISYVINKKFVKFLNFINKWQSILILTFSIISIINLLPGSLSKKGFIDVSRVNSHNFSEAEWILSNINQNDIVLSENHRSYVFLSKFLSREKYFKFSNQSKIYDLLKKSNFNYIVLIYPISNSEIKKFVEYCTDYENRKTKEFNVATRNFLSSIRDKKTRLILLKKTC